MARKDKLSRVFSAELSPDDEERLPAGNRPASTGKPAPFGLNRYAADHLKRPNAKYIQEIEPDLIQAHGPTDRMDELDPVAEEALRLSIQKTGQTTPVLLRPDPNERGKFRIIYGRRRVRAMKALGLPVKAIVRDDISDEDAVVIQGQENSVRKDLSFLERARFLVAIEAEGFPRAVAIDALAIDKARASNYAKLGNALPDAVAHAIGPAPGIGRNRWLDFVALWDTHETPEPHVMEALTAVDPVAVDSDARFGLAFEALKTPRAAATKPDKPSEFTRHITDGEGRNRVVFAKLKTANGALSVTVPARSKRQKEFAAHLSSRIDDLIREELERWQSAGAPET